MTYEERIAAIQARKEEFKAARAASAEKAKAARAMKKEEIDAAIREINNDIEELDKKISIEGEIEAAKESARIAKERSKGKIFALKLLKIMKKLEMS